VPALNDLLKPFGAAFAGGSHDLRVEVPGIKGPWNMASGSALGALPEGGFLFNGSKEGHDIHHPVLGVAGVGAGRLALYGDSNCLDSSHMRVDCFDLLEKILAYAVKQDDGVASPLLAPPARISSDFGLSAFEESGRLPARRDDLNFTEASFVLKNPVVKCYRNAPLENQGLGYQVLLPATSTSKAAKVPSRIVAPTEPLMDSDSTANDLEASHGNESSEEGKAAGAVTTSEPWQHRLVGLSLPTGWVPGRMMHSTQLFSIGGGIGLVVLWSLARKRRAASTNGSPNVRRANHLLPMFWRHYSRVRRE